MRSRSSRPNAAFAPRNPLASWAIAAVMACPALGLRTASAEFSLAYSDVTLATTVQLGNVATIDRTTFPAGGPGLVSGLLQPRWGRFPASQSALPGGFISSLLTTTGFSGVGVSGVQALGTDANAFAELRQSITNTGPVEAGLFLEYSIPGLEASILEFGVDQRLEAGVSAIFTTFHFRADGSLLAEQTLFDYSVLTTKLAGTSDFEVSRSDDLLAEQGVGSTFDMGSLMGVRYREFTGERPLAILEPGERLDMIYTLIASVENPGANEVGFQALVGDPFQVSGTGGFRVTSAAVPEPASIGLLATGLLGALAVRCRRRGFSPRRRRAAASGSR